MCVAIPLKVQRIEGEWAWVGNAAAPKKINSALISGLRPGDYVLIHAGFAIQKLDPAKARQTLRFLKKELTVTLE
jgi:hydrogenase expression/formation protein HypC